MLILKPHELIDQLRSFSTSNSAQKSVIRRSLLRSMNAHAARLQPKHCSRCKASCHSIVYEHMPTICTHFHLGISFRLIPVYNLLMNRRAAKRRRRWGRMYLEKM